MCQRGQQFTMRLKMQRAGYLLDSTTLPRVEVIAAQLGFDDPLYFFAQLPAACLITRRAPLVPRVEARTDYQTTENTNYGKQGY